jgi:hypothetical protein
VTPNLYRYSFVDSAPIDEVETTLFLAILGAEAIHGASQVMLDVSHAFDAQKRSCVIDASTGAGRDVNKLFAGFLAKEFGPDSFRVERVQSKHPEPVA